MLNSAIFLDDGVGGMFEAVDEPNGSDFGRTAVASALSSDNFKSIRHKKKRRRTNQTRVVAWLWGDGHVGSESEIQAQRPERRSQSAQPKRLGVISHFELFIRFPNLDDE